VARGAASPVGERVVWTQESPAYRRVEGVVVATRPFGKLTNERGTFPGIQYLIHDDETGENVWTCTFADEGADFPEDIGD
jgi:hypothetical protein